MSGNIVSSRLPVIQLNGIAMQSHGMHDSHDSDPFALLEITSILAKTRPRITMSGEGRTCSLHYLLARQNSLKPLVGMLSFDGNHTEEQTYLPPGPNQSNEMQPADEQVRPAQIGMKSDATSMSGSSTGGLPSSNPSMSSSPLLIACTLDYDREGWRERLNNMLQGKPALGKLAFELSSTPGAHHQPPWTAVARSKFPVGIRPLSEDPRLKHC